MIDKIKKDEKFRNKIIRISLITVLSVTIVAAVLLNSSEKTSKGVVNDKTNMIDISVKDSTSLPEKKEVIYNDDKIFEQNKEKGIGVMKDESNFGVSPEEIEEKKKEQVDAIKAYMDDRREKANEIKKESTTLEEDELQTREEKRREYLGENGTGVQNNSRINKEVRKKTKAELEAEYYHQLAQAKKEREEKAEKAEKTVEFRAVFYKDQRVIPGERARLILPNDVVIDNHIFPKGTDIYATVSITKSRVLLKITNINHFPVNLAVKDLQDGEEGIYSQQAGKLWNEYQQDLQEQAIQQAGREVSREFNVPLISAGITSLRAFFSKKRFSDKEKILLLNDHEVVLTNQFEKSNYQDNTKQKNILR